MKQMKRFFLLACTALLIAALLSGCGSSGGMASDSTSSNSSAVYAPGNAKGAYDAYDASMMEQAEYGWDNSGSAPDGATTGSNVPANVKMIYTANIAMESTEFDKAAAGLESLVDECGGWFESSYLDNYGSYRRASYTIRVPNANFNAFCAKVGELCQVNSLQRGSEDVSEYYYDTESRLVTQQTKLERLQDLLSKAEDMEDIITLESAISETELVIEQLTGTLRKFDSLVDYSTIDVTLTEVYKLTETEEPAIGFSAKLAAAFRAGSSNFVDGLQAFLLGFARNWAGWIFWLMVLVVAPVVIVLVIVRNARKRKVRRMPQAPQMPVQPRMPEAPKGQDQP